MTERGQKETNELVLEMMNGKLDAWKTEYEKAKKELAVIREKSSLKAMTIIEGLIRDTKRIMSTMKKVDRLSQ